MNTENTLGIKHWAPEDRPREKLILKGKAALSDAELIAILLGTGISKVSAVELARRILLAADHNLHSLGNFTITDLTKVKGIGSAKAISIVAALELGRRRKDIAPDQKPKINGSAEAFEILKSHLLDLPHEEFWVLLLNRANRVIRKVQISQGGVSGTVADPKLIFKCALEELAS